MTDFNELPIKIKNTSNKGYVLFNVSTGSQFMANLDPRKLKLLSDTAKQKLQNEVKVNSALCGNPSLTLLLSTIISAANIILSRNGSGSLINAHTLFKNGKSHLIFDNQLGLHPNIYSSSYSILSKDGISQAFGAITHNNLNHSRNRGDIVEKREKETSITSPLPIPSLTVPKPSSIIIVDKGKSSTTKTDEEKKQLLTQVITTYLRGTAPLISFSKYIEQFHELRKDIPINVSSEINLR